MIVGIGTDIVNIERILRILENEGERFVVKYFTEQEIKLSKKHKGRKYAAFFAKRFSGKEAISKAIGTGFGKKLSFLDVSIENAKGGKPVVKLSARAQKLIGPKAKVEISLSDDLTINAAIALALIHQG